MRRVRATDGGRGAGREGGREGGMDGGREGVREGEILREIGLKLWALDCLS